jgi:alkanesulfonate monooxygenase SsuD/methylene tetrahydromethanopterin reductase-like flavin-dependent oxidoreductase (luciferase family)
MTWCFVGRTEQEWRARVARARERDPDFEDDWIEEACVFGTPEQAASRIRAFADAGAQRIVLNHALFDDLDMVELLAAEVFPLVGD